MVLRHRDRTISLAEPDFHSSESGSARFNTESLSGAVVVSCQNYFSPSGCARKMRSGNETRAVEEAKSFNRLGLKYDLNNARLHSLSA